MKRYIRSNTSIELHSCKIPVEYTDYGIQIMTSDEISSWIAQLCDIVSDHVSQECVDQCQLYLDVYGSYEDEEFDRMQASLQSHLVASIDRPLGRGKIESNAPCCVLLYREDGPDYSTEKWSPTSIAKFEAAIPGFIQFVSSEMRKLDTFERNDYPSDAVVAASTLSYWTVKEKLGNSQSLSDAFDYLMSRTYENKRSGYYHEDGILESINVLIDYAIACQWTCKELISFSKSCAEYLRRRPQ